MAGEAQLFLNTIKAVVQQMMQGANLADCVFGTVVSENPLEIKVDSFAEALEADDLTLTNAVKDHFVDIEIGCNTTMADNHTHSVKGRKKIRICNGLKVGERVLLLRRSGGQQYVVLDRITEHITNGEWNN